MAIIGSVITDFFVLLTETLEKIVEKSTEFLVNFFLPTFHDFFDKKLQKHFVEKTSEKIED